MASGHGQQHLVAEQGQAGDARQVLGVRGDYQVHVAAHQRRQVRLGRLDLVPEAVRQVQQLVAGLGEAGGAAAPVVEGNAQPVFQLADPVGQGRRRQVQTFRLPGNGQQAR